MYSHGQGEESRTANPFRGSNFEHETLRWKSGSKKRGREAQW
jgi:Ca2+-binding EF-hand superfamily protein